MPWNIIGHEWALEHLERSMQQDQLSHAYLFAGPPEIGKARLALRLAQALNCEGQQGVPCLQCKACQRIERRNYPDVRLTGMATQGAELKAEEAARQKELKVDTIRQWQHDILLKPYEGRRRVFILHDAERLNEESSNAMLKTLEEPPPYATLILVANSLSLLPTIVSRCQMLRLRPLSRQTVTQALLAQKTLAPERAALLAAWSRGRIGWALRMAEQPAAFQEEQEKLDTLLALQQQPRSVAFRWADERNQEYRNGEQATVCAWLELWQGWWRDVLLLKVGSPAGITHVDRQELLASEAQRYDLVLIHRFIAQLGATQTYLRENVNPQLALENLFLHLPAISCGE